MAVGKPVTLGLFAAWLVHDMEEWFTMGPWSRNHARPDWGPARWTRLRWLQFGVSDDHVHVGITIMGALVAAAAIAGACTGGRSRFFQACVAVFGLHGIGHLALSAGFWGYTPGVATSPIVVIPYSVWAWRALGRAGVRGSAHRSMVDVAIAAILLPVVLAGTHTIAAILTR
jgi:Protein of unknown function with HXXEE motif